MNGYNLADHIFPVGSGIANDDTLQFGLNCIEGSAFSISDDFFISAGHIFENMKSYGGDIIIGFYVDRYNWGGKKILAYEINKQYDLAIFKVNVPSAKAHCWSAESALINTDVCSFGFPFALDAHNARLQHRFFKGYIVSRTPNFRLQNAPESYELSFMCPRGLSGAFILNQGDEIVGIVLGNTDIEIEIYNEKVEEPGSDKIRHYLKTETMKLGCGLTSASAFNAYFDLLGSTLGEYLRKNGRIKS